MRIYNTVVIDIASNRVIYEDSYVYHGKFAHCCGGGGGASYPQPSPQELEILDLQLKYLKDMGEDTEKLRPYLLASMGLKEDAEGNFTKMTDEEYYESLGELDQKGYDVAMAAAERSLKAYAGELEISPALEKSLGQRKTELEENLSRSLGSGWQGTTAGIQAMAQFDETSSLIREEVRSGIITNEGAMTLASLDYMAGIGKTTMAGFPGQQSGGLFGGAGAMASQYSQERYHQWEAASASAQARASRRSGLMSGIGELIGSGITAYGGYKAAGY